MLVKVWWMKKQGLALPSPLFIFSFSLFLSFFLIIYFHLFPSEKDEAKVSKMYSASTDS
jgi:hypothetical protein